MSNIKHIRFIPILYAILAALFYGFSVPLSKLLLDHLSPYMMSSLLYFGAGFGMLIISLLNTKPGDTKLTKTYGKKDIKYLIMMILLDILAPILLMNGLIDTDASTVSLLNNLEIVFTALIAMVFFKEFVGKKMWIAILFIVSSGILLSFEDIHNFQMSFSALLVILATISWGLENNCTRMLSHGNPIYVVIIKGIGSGIGSLLIAIILYQPSFNWIYILLALLLGFFSYGLSLYFYISAQRYLGASRTSAYYAVAPFIGALFSFIFLHENLSYLFGIAFIIMLIGTWITLTVNHEELSKIEIHSLS